MATLVEHGFPNAISEDSKDYKDLTPGTKFNFFGQEYAVDGAGRLVRTDDAPIVPRQDTDRGLRYNKGKPRYDLLPPDGIHELVKVFTYGAEKYAPRNWEKGMPWMEVLACLKRHIAAWEMGEKDDKESNLPHLAMATWNALALLTYEIRKAGTDDRPIARTTTQC